MSDPTAELEDFLTRELTGQQPRTVSDALKVADETPEVPAPPEDAPEVVRDEPPERVEEPEAPPTPPEPEPEGEPEEEPEPEEEENEYVAWAIRKYGEDRDKWAKAARDMETHITRLTQEKHASDELAVQWYQYAQQQEQQAQQAQHMGMPLSAQEEQFVENSLTNPLEYARQAAFNGRVSLYNGVITRVAEENPSLAAQIGTQVQMELAQYAQAQQAEQTVTPTLEGQLGASFQRLGINLQKDGPRMSEKLSELGEYHPYVRAILEGNDGERDLAVQAVFDLTRASTFSSRQVEREKAVKREEELRHEAMVVQTGGVQPPPPPRQPSDFEKGMQEEWKRAGAWPYPDE